MPEMYIIYTSNFARNTTKFFVACPQEDVPTLLAALEQEHPRLEFEVDTVEALAARFPRKAISA